MVNLFLYQDMIHTALSMTVTVNKCQQICAFSFRKERISEGWDAFSSLWVTSEVTQRWVAGAATHTVAAPSSEKAAKRKYAFHVCLQCWSSQKVLCKWKYLAVRDPPATPERVSTSRPRFCCITEVSSKLRRRCLRIGGSRGSTAFVRLHLRCQKTIAAQSWRRSISSWCGCCGGWSTSTFLQHVSFSCVQQCSMLRLQQDWQ